MIVTKLSIKNILGIESMEVSPGSVTEVSGSNGAGKTSIMEALRAVLSGGHDGTLLRAGSEKGEVVLVLDDGTEIRKTVGADKSQTVVKHPTFGKLPKPAEFIKKLSDALALNPVTFLSAPKKDRSDQLLSAIPMKITADQVSFVPTAALRGVDLDKHALESIGAISKAVYDLRTGVNRVEKEKRATAAQMAEALPPDAPEGDWGDVLTATTGEWQALHKATSARLAVIEAERVEYRDAADGEALAQIIKVKEKLQAAIDKLRAEATAEIDLIRQGAERADARADSEAAAKREAEEAVFRPKEAELKEKIGHARAMVEQQAQAEKAREFIAKMEAEADSMKEQSTALTSALSKLEVLKASLLEKLPIPGLSVQDGDIYLDGIPFDRVNTARKVAVAIEVAKLRAGELGLVAVDGLELLDDKTFTEFKKSAAKSNVQFVISRVSEGPLTVSTEEVA